MTKKTNNKAMITSIISNRYHVYYENEIVVAIAMGKLRLGEKPMVGDFVELEWLDEQYVIQKVLPRKNALKRPVVANVDQALIVTSAKEPDFSFQLTDRLIFLVAYEGIEPVVVLSKADLLSEAEIAEIQDEYQKAGYQVVVTGKNDQAEGVYEILKDKTSVLAGQSGVGKSSILNRINPEFQIKTQQISKALNRGKHTTRHNELFAMGGGWIADTPGFSSLDFSKLDPLRLAQSVPDFKAYADQCRFRDCLHINEPSCKIKEEVENGTISKRRYCHYVEVIEQI